MPHQVHDADLDLRPGVNCFQCLRESLETIHTSDQDVLEPTVLQLRQDIQPELRSFRLADPEPE